MKTGIRLIAQHYELATGKTLEETVVHECELSICHLFEMNSKLGWGMNPHPNRTQ